MMIYVLESLRISINEIIFNKLKIKPGMKAALFYIPSDISGLQQFRPYEGQQKRLCSSVY